MTICALNVMKAEVRQSKVLLQSLQDELDPNDNTELARLKSKGHWYYYQSRKEDGKRKLTYLGNALAEAVKWYFSRQYRRSLAKILKKNIQILERCIDNYTEVTPEEVYRKMPKPYSELPKEPYLDARFEEIKRWANKDYMKNPREMPKNYSVAKDGTKVRSKGECIWYNELLNTGIPFRYDCVIELIDEKGEIVQKCPDFMIWCYDGTFLIIEHLGKLDSIKYSLDFGEKLHCYHGEDFIPGYNLVITSDDKNGGTDSTKMLLAIEHVKRMFYRI